MEQNPVDILPDEVFAWVREDAGLKMSRLWVRAMKEYWVDQDACTEAAGIGEGDDVNPDMVRGVMEIPPERGRGGWTLRLTAEDSIGLRQAGEDEGYETDSDMTVDAFEADFLQSEPVEVEVVVLAEDAAAWRRFQRWLARQRARR